MQTLLWFLFIYVFILVVWLALNLVFFAISYLSRRSVSSILLGINMIINYIVYIVLGIWGLSLYWNALIHKQWFLFILLLIFGSIIIGFYQMIASLIVMPFTFLSTYFVEKTESLKQSKRDEYRAEVISPDGKVIEAYESNDLINRKLAIFFLLDYFGHLFYLVTHPQQYTLYGWWDYIFRPFFFLLQGIAIYILFVLLYNRLRHGKFIFMGWKHIITQTLKFDFFFTLGIQILAIAVYIFFPSIFRN